MSEKAQEWVAMRSFLVQLLEALPFAREDREDHVVDPLASEPQALYEVSLFSHPAPLEQPD